MPNPWDADPIVADPGATSSLGSDPAAASDATRAPVPSASAAPVGGGDPWSNDPVVSPAPAVPSSTDSTMHGLGLGARGVVQAVSAIPGAVYDAIGAPINSAMDMTMGAGNGPRVPHAAEAVDAGLTKLGLPEAATPTERVIQDVYKGVGGAVGGIGLGAAMEATASGPFTAALGRMLQQAPVMQAASGATSGAAQGVAREDGAGPVGQALAGVAGAMAPSVGAFAGSAALRGAVRGGEDGALQMQRNIASFDGAAGATPSLGQATQRPALQAIETGLSNTISGGGIMQRAGQRQLDAMDGTISDLVSQLSPHSAPEDAGDAIVRGVQSFKNSFRDTQRNLYSKVDSLIDSQTPVRVDATKQAMADLNADIQGAPALSEWFKNSKIQGLQQALESDVAGAPQSVMVVPRQPLTGVQAVEANLKAGRPLSEPVPQEPLQVVIPEYPPTNELPYQALSKLRTLVGQELSNNSLTSDIPRSKWSALYSALSDDLGTAAANAGPQAQQAWQRANDYTRAGMARLDKLSDVVSKSIPEQVHRAAMGASGEATRISTVMKSIPVQDRRQVTATVLQRMGLANPGNQDEVGDVFSSERFLTNYAKLSEQARNALLSGTGFPGLQQKVEALARVAAVRRDSGSVFSNPSGTARLGALMAQASALGTAIATGNPVHIAAALGGLSVPAVAAKGVTNPGIVNWFAQTTRAPEALAPAAAEAALRGVSQQQPAPATQAQPQQHLANGGQVFRTYTEAARARFQSGGEFHIAPSQGGFSLVPKFADGGQVQAAAGPAPAPAPVITNDVDAKAHEAATSPLNDHPEPSAPQQAAGNFRKGHLRIGGMDISIENPSGSARRGVAPDGTAWESQLAAHYGYVKGSKGADGDQLDAFVGPNPDSRKAFVIDQLTPDGAKFDEHKAALGFNSAEEAKDAYMKSYSPGWRGFGGITEVPVPMFRAWAKSGKLKEPLAWSPHSNEQPTAQAA